MRALIAAAHAKGMKVFSTSSPTTPRTSSTTPSTSTPMSRGRRLPTGTPAAPFDDAAVCRGDSFPPVDAATSFPYTRSSVRRPMRRSKVPRGSTTRRCSHNRGDFDLRRGVEHWRRLRRPRRPRTERPEVVRGWEIYKTWVGFRDRRLPIDNGQARQPAVLAALPPLQIQARAAGSASRPSSCSLREIPTATRHIGCQFTTARAARAALDFPSREPARLRRRQTDDRCPGTSSPVTTTTSTRTQCVLVADLPRQPRRPGRLR